MASPARKTRLEVEKLEARQLLAASITLNGSVVNIVGSRFADRVVATNVGNKIKIKMSGGARGSRMFQASSVTEIDFVNKGRRDRFRNHTSVPSSVFSHGSR